MAKKFSSPYTVGFVAIVAFVCALLLSLAAGGLQSRIEENRRLDVNRNILKSLDAFGSRGLPESEVATAEDIAKFFDVAIDSLVVDTAGRPIETAANASEIQPWTETNDPLVTSVRLPIYMLKREDGSIEAYCFPVWGKGLWGEIRGYLAIQADGRTVRGITFLSDHKETPGLGARIEELAWQQQWIGKTIFDENGKLTPITITVGAVPEDWSDARKQHHIDGISGATMTGKGVNSFMDKCLRLYEAFLRDAARRTAASEESNNG